MWKDRGKGRGRRPTRKKTCRPLSLCFQVERADGTTTFVLLPARFHKRLWIKRGGYLVVTDGGAAAAPTATRGEVVAVLYARDVARLRRMEGVWPAEFGDGRDDDGREEGGGDDDGDDGGDGDRASSDSSGLPPLEANPNRRRPTYETSSSEEE